MHIYLHTYEHTRYQCIYSQIHWYLEYPWTAKTSRETDTVTYASLMDMLAHSHNIIHQTGQVWSEQRTCAQKVEKVWRAECMCVWVCLSQVPGIESPFLSADSSSLEHSKTSLK